MGQIVAKTQGGFLVEFTVTELNHLAGMTGYPPHKWSVGGTIDADQMFSQLDNLKSARVRINGAMADIEKARKMLEKVGLPEVIFEPRKTDNPA